ncbi:MAG: hypothetical protein KGI06_00040 [Candidatus Micrarchaeota archaeon]|nr:hypothetical protein [Candidatus Micrarchaeota archaeon]
MARGKKRRVTDFTRGKRPLGVALITVFEVVAALYMLLGVVSFSAIRHFMGMGNFVGMIAGFGGAILLLIGIVLLFSAYGFWSGSDWGWWLGIAISGFLIFSIVFLNVLGLVLGLAMVYYITRRRVKRWFGVL